MERKALLLSVLFLVISFFVRSNKKEISNSCELSNIEALANWEIDFVFCANVTSNICVVFLDDGMFIIGVRQYG